MIHAGLTGTGEVGQTIKGLVSGFGEDCSPGGRGSAGPWYSFSGRGDGLVLLRGRAAGCCRDPGTAGAGPVAAAGGQGKQPRCIAFSGCIVGSRLAPRWRTHLCGAYLDRSSAWRARTSCASERRRISLSDCLRAVPRSNNLNFEYRYLPESFAPRPRLERGTYCLGGTFEVSPGSAGCGLTYHSAAS